MNKLDFLSQLMKNLSNLPKEEVENAINYYEEYFNDAGNTNEELVVKELGSPAKIASQIIASYTINDIDSSPKSMKSGIVNIGHTFKALLKSSIALPISILIAVCTICSLIAMGVLIISLFGGSICSIILAVSCVVEGFEQANLFENTIFYIASYWSAAIMVIGLGLCCFSIFLVVADNGFNWIAKFVSKILLRRDKK